MCCIFSVLERRRRKDINFLFFVFSVAAEVAKKPADFLAREKFQKKIDFSKYRNNTQFSENQTTLRHQEIAILQDFYIDLT